ncbi:hypothetical protein LB505_008702 [Fusarium chuoi]|nr:hypothetical protein LB503_003017 [Fusarium chuoi]KAI1045515.1 hypothetical protein LB505_008702 [Fusarium chuoi]
MNSSSYRSHLALSPINRRCILTRCSYALSRESASIMAPGTMPHICKYLEKIYPAAPNTAAPIPHLTAPATPPLAASQAASLASSLCIAS